MVRPEYGLDVISCDQNSAANLSDPCYPCRPLPVSFDQALRYLFKVTLHPEW